MTPLHGGMIKAERLTVVRVWCHRDSAVIQSRRTSRSVTSRVPMTASLHSGLIGPAVLAPAPSVASLAIAPDIATSSLTRDKVLWFNYSRRRRRRRRQSLRAQDICRRCSHRRQRVNATGNPRQYFVSRVRNVTSPKFVKFVAVCRVAESETSRLQLQCQ